jgi:serine/threonine protein kinase
MGKSPAATIAAILTAPHDPIESIFVSKTLRDIINRLLIKDPKQRPSIEVVIKVPIIRYALDDLL